MSVIIEKAVRGRKQLLKLFEQAKPPASIAILHNSGRHIFVQMHGNWRVGIVLRRGEEEIIDVLAKTRDPVEYYAWSGTRPQLLNMLKTCSNRHGHLAIMSFVRSHPERRDYENALPALSKINFGDMEWAKREILKTEERLRKRSYSPWKDPRQLRLFPVE